MFTAVQLGAAPRRMFFTLLGYVEGAVLVYLARVFWPLPFSRDFLLVSSRSFIASVQPVRAYAKPLAALVLMAIVGFQLLLLSRASWLASPVLSSLLPG